MQIYLSHYFLYGTCKCQQGKAAVPGSVGLLHLHIRSLLIFGNISALHCTAPPEQRPRQVLHRRRQVRRHRCHGGARGWPASLAIQIEFERRRRETEEEQGLFRANAVNEEGSERDRARRRCEGYFSMILCTRTMTS